MSVIQPHKTITKFAQSTSIKEDIIATVGDVKTIKVLKNDVMVATYIRPEKTAGGIIRPDSVLDEDLYQGKVGLVIKLGPTAFNDDEYFGDVRANLHDWVVYRTGDTWDLTVRDVPCRVVKDSNIRLIVDDPEEIF